MDENNHNVEAQQQTEENDETTRCQYCDAVKDEDELVECCECTNRMCDDCAHHCADCDTPICEECGASYCTSCMEEYHDHEDTQEPDYIDPYHSNAKARNVFTFGLEIEIGADHDHDMMQTNPLIAGWCPDGSLHKHGALEYQTQPMTMNQVDELTDLVARIEPVDDNSQAGGHMHISRADRQTPGRWYWALHALNKEQAESLNMRHMTETRWCQLMRGEYNGKATAINNTHADTIEFRTFGPWWSQTANKLTPAVTYMHTMWRFFQRHPLYQLKRSDSMATSITAYRNAINGLTIKKEAEACA
mgnify:CR=1 FL=1